jgi:hypothetical protein
VSRTTADIHARWSGLSNSSVTDAGTEIATSELGVPTGFGTVKLGLSAEGRAQVLLPVAPGTRRPRLTDLPALEVGASQWADTTGSRAYLIVTCTDPVLDRAFADLVLAILSRIEDGEAPATALTEAVRELRALFDRPVDEAVSLEQVQGLAAELLVLQRLASKNPRAAELWFGPDRDRHDFRGGAHAIEVKSTRRRSGAVTISSIDQLDIPAQGSLELWRVVLERTANGQTTIASLVSAIEAVTGPSNVLRERLKAMGCPDPFAMSWNRWTFNVEAIDGYRVEEDFPRIVAGSFGEKGTPPGISSLKYEIDLGQAAGFALTEVEMQMTEDKVLSCLN